jgi:hypothetical protein
MAIHIAVEHQIADAQNAMAGDFIEMGSEGNAHTRPEKKAVRNRSN